MAVPGLLAAVLVLLGRVLSRQSTPAPGDMEALWPSAAILLGLLLVRGERRAQAIAIVGGGIAALLIAAAWHGFGAWQTAECIISTVGTSLIAFGLLRARGSGADLLARANGVLALVSASALASLLPAVLALSRQGDTPVRQVLSAYSAHLLSLLVITPMVVIAFGLIARRGQLADRATPELALLLAGVAGVSALVFSMGALPLLFLIAPAVLLTTFRLRAPGAVAAMTIVAIVSTYATAHGLGPIALAPASFADRMLIQQLFLACCFLSALPVAAVLAERDRRAAEASALAEHFRAVVETIGEVIFLVDARGRWAYLNPAWEQLSGGRIADSLGRPWLERIEPGDAQALARHAAPVLAGSTATLRQTLRFQAPGGTRWVELFLQSMRDANGRPAGATGTLRDVDERMRLEETSQLARRNAEQRAREATVLASTDELTGIANRRAFLHQLDREIQASIEHGWPLAVALFDVDHFKAVNDRYGHAVGDRVLQHISQRAVASVRGGDLVGRLGGEEFAILMPGASAQEATIVAERLRRAVQAPSEPMPLPAVTVSIGIAQREDQRSAESLLGEADVALYAAKGEGRNRISVAA